MTGLGSSLASAGDECASKPVVFPGGLAGFGREAAIHDAQVLAAMPQWVRLTYMSSANKAAGPFPVPRRWYESSQYLCPDQLGMIRNPNVLTQCDEFPMYATVEGGPSAYEQTDLVLQRIFKDDNETAGQAYGAMTTACGMLPASPDGTPSPDGKSDFLIVPLPTLSVMSFFVCGTESPL